MPKIQAAISSSWKPFSDKDVFSSTLHRSHSSAGQEGELTPTTHDRGARFEPPHLFFIESTLVTGDEIHLTCWKELWFSSFHWTEVMITQEMLTCNNLKTTQRGVEMQIRRPKYFCSLTHLVQNLYFSLLLNVKLTSILLYFKYFFSLAFPFNIPHKADSLLLHNEVFSPSEA